MLDIHQNVPIFAGSATVGYEHENHYLRCSMLVLDLNAGDQVDVTDIEGDQRCGLLVFDTQSKNSVPELILTDCQSENIDVTTLSQEDFFPDLNDYLNCNRKKLDNKCLTIINLTSAGGRPNCSALFEAKQSVVGILLAFGSSMHVDSQDSPTDLRVRVRRSFEKSTDTPSPLPQPLAETLEEIRVNKASALSYTVKKGQYIQIIDVEGHQCSDFQAFARHDLDKGETLGIEPTVTRTFAGLSYPAPGVHDKYYNVNSIPLVEIIRDTVGRHDTFGLACNSKYYEDLGHLGHANCTDNFNQTLAQYGIKPRLNWVTVNLFFNTNVEECHTISSDVSWSRPGDYVL